MGRPPNGESAGHGKFPTPVPGSRYYVPPPRSKQLRWQIAIHLVGPGMFVLLIICSALTRDWPGFGFALVFSGYYGLLRSSSFAPPCGSLLADAPASSHATGGNSRFPDARTDGA
jgi:hypothetical protein